MILNMINCENTIDKIQDRIRGALYGVAIGDAMGGPLEFLDANEIKMHHGQVREMIGGGWLSLKPGEVTDDTQMTLCVAEGILENPSDPVQTIGRRFIEWYDSKPKDIGNTCALAIRKVKLLSSTKKAAWAAVSREIEQEQHGMNGGNGALMRTIYPAVFYHDPKTRKRYVKAIAEMTHRNDESTDICVQYCDFVRMAVFGDYPDRDRLKHYKANARPTGYVVDTWCNVIDALTETQSFEEAIINAVNRGGDADTIGAITGGLAGACYGYSAIPKRWIECLDKQLTEELDSLTRAAIRETERYCRRLEEALLLQADDDPENAQQGK